jgi:uncharacterized delta-60 repeat protein
LFGAGGTVVTPVGSAAAGVHSVAVQGDGKIVVAGFAFDGTQNDFAVARYNANGTLDTTFNHTGEVLTHFGSTPSAAFGLALQGDGKIVVVGEAGTQFAVARYNANGTLDTTFNHTGEVLTSFAGSTAFANAVALQGDGKIVVVGEAGTGFGITRYNTNGTLDSSFYHNGVDLITFGSATADANAVALQGDGKLVVAGTVSLGTENYFAAIRLTPGGSLDGTFNGSGGTALPMGADASATSLLLQADGKVLLAGSSNGQFALARLNANGSLDTSFGQNGETTAAFGGAFAWANDMAFAANGKILVAGTAVESNSQSLDFALAQFNLDGSLDSGFNGTGKVLTGLGADTEAATLAVQGDGKIVLAGSSDGQFALARYIPGPDTPAPTSTTTVLSSSDNSSVFGEAVTFTATIIRAPGGGGGTLGGTVTFRDGNTVLGTASVVGGQARWTTSALAVGAHDQITASYSGNSSFAASTSAPLVQSVVAAPTTTVLNSSANPAPFGQAVTFTAHVYPVAPGAGVPTGIVTFLDGATVLGNRPLSHGVATLTVWRPLSAGPHQIRAIYYGSTDFTGSTSAMLAESVKAASNTALSLGPGSGSGMALTAIVTSSSAGTPRPTGTVTFKDGSVVLGAMSLPASGQAVFQLPKPLAPGAHSFTAYYSGDGDFLASLSLPVGIVVDPVG